MARRIHIRLVRRGPATGFSLLEVVVAIGVFTVGVLGVIALFLPVARSTSEADDTVAAARFAEVLRVHLHTRPWMEVASLLKASVDAPAPGAMAAPPVEDPATDSQMLFASRDGRVIGPLSDPIWSSNAGDPPPRKFFEIALIRLETTAPALSSSSPGAMPGDGDDMAALLAYVARVRWPVSIDEHASSAAQGGSQSAAPRSDASPKQVRFFAGSVSR